jgi:hypothetical protein
MKACVLAGAMLVLAAPARAQTAAPEPQDQPAPVRPALVMRAFGSVQFGATDRPGDPSTFNLGQFALFFTTALSERVSVLGEIVMEGSTNTRVVTDLERLQLTFRWNDYVHVTGGRYHSGIGYYNTAFHHGAYFEIPIGRPRVFQFEDEGGVLPIHDVGVTVRGQVPGTGGSLHYLAEVGNGRPWTDPVDEDPEGRDVNDAKATNVGLSYQPDRWRGAEFGASFYRDRLARSPDESVDHRIAAAYAVYRTPTIEIMGEWLTLWHRTGTGASHRSRAGYAQLSKAFGKVRPYYRFDRLAIDRDAPFIGEAGAQEAHTFGVRFDPGEWIGLKTQYERSLEHETRRVNSVRAELVFVF